MLEMICVTQTNFYAEGMYSIVGRKPVFMKVITQGSDIRLEEDLEYRYLSKWRMC